MKQLKQFGYVILLFVSYSSLGQQINERLSIISKCDTSTISIHISDVYYFGENMEKAKAFPQLTCSMSGKRYNLLWVSSKSYKKRAKVTANDFKEYVFGMKNNGFENYPCFALIVDEKITNYPESNTTISELQFPSMVEIYEYKENSWVKLFEKEIKSFKEYGELELELIKSN